MSDTAFTDVSDVIADSGGGGGGGGGGGTASQITIYIDGNDVTNCCVNGSWTRRLNRPSVAQIKVPMDCAVYDVGSRLRIDILLGTTWEIVFHGFILLAETDTSEDFGYTVYNATDPMELWNWRPVRDDNCAFMPAADDTIITQYEFGPQILEAMLTKTVDCGGGVPEDAEGEIFLDMGTFEGGGVSLLGAPVDWPMTIMEMFSLLVSTGELDGVITPADPGGGVMGTIDAYNGDYGTDLSGSISFDYGQGNYNVRNLRWNRDMTNMVNKYWLYGGPRVGTANDPAGDQHWCFNVTGDDPYLPGNVSGGSGPGGALPGSPNEAAPNPLGIQIDDSRTTYGVRMLVDIFDAEDEDCSGTPGDPMRALFRRRWQIFSWGASIPREIIHVMPTRDTEIGTFDIGDLVSVTATSAVRGGFSGAQRVYEYTVSWDEDGVLALSELQTSADMEGVK